MKTFTGKPKRLDQQGYSPSVGKGIVSETPYRINGTEYIIMIGPQNGKAYTPSACTVSNSATALSSKWKPEYAQLSRTA